MAACPECLQRGCEIGVFSQCQVRRAPVMQGLRLSALLSFPAKEARGYPASMGGRIRPGFEWTVSLSAVQVLDRVGRRLMSQDCPVSGLVAPGRIELHVHGDEQHMWSPQLIVDVDTVNAGASRLVARFGPHPSVWTLYLAGYAVSCLVGMMSGVLAIAQLILGETPWALWGVPLAAILSAALYFAALFGQGLSKEQMDQLETFLRKTVSVDSSRDRAVA